MKREIVEQLSTEGVYTRAMGVRDSDGLPAASASADEPSQTNIFQQRFAFQWMMDPFITSKGTHLLSAASMSSTASQARRASMEVAPNSFDAFKASATAVEESTRAACRVVREGRRLAKGAVVQAEAVEARRQKQRLFMVVVIIVVVGVRLFYKKDLVE